MMLTTLDTAPNAIQRVIKEDSMYDWAMKCSACEEINTAEFFPNDSDLCVDCQGETIPDQLKLPLAEGDQG